MFDDPKPAGLVALQEQCRVERKYVSRQLSNANRLLNSGRSAAAEECFDRAREGFLRLRTAERKAAFYPWPGVNCEKPSKNAATV